FDSAGEETAGIARAEVDILGPFLLRDLRYLLLGARTPPQADGNDLDAMRVGEGPAGGFQKYLACGIPVTRRGLDIGANRPGAGQSAAPDDLAAGGENHAAHSRLPGRLENMINANEVVGCQLGQEIGVVWSGRKVNQSAHSLHCPLDRFRISE